MEDLQRNLRHILANRHSAEARGFWETLLKEIERRVKNAQYNRWSDVLRSTETEELVGDVLFDLMQGGLARFRGESIGELYAFIRTICERKVARAAQKRIRERKHVDFKADLTFDDRTVPAKAEVSEGPGWKVDSPLPTKDQTYLTELLQAGSKAELARRKGVSRAAVTQRIQRIHVKLQELGEQARLEHRSWLQRQAESVIAAEPTPS